MSEVLAATRILFLRTDRLGETVLNLPVVAALARALPKATITFLCQPELAPLISKAPGVARVLTYEGTDPHWWVVRAMRLAMRLRPERFDLAIVSNPKKELHVATWLAGIPCRVGYDRKWAGLLTRRIPDRKVLGERHEVEYNYDLVTILGLPVSIPSWRLPLDHLEQQDAVQHLERQGVKLDLPMIAVHPWTSNPAKRWEPARFRALLEALAKRGTAASIIIGGIEERGPGQALLTPEIPGVVNLIGALSVTQLAAVLARACVLVSNDSGPVHVAAAVGTPTVVLFGEASTAAGARRWGPWGTGHTVICKRSLDEIQVDEVLWAVDRHLKNPPSATSAKGGSASGGSNQPSAS